MNAYTIFYLLFIHYSLLIPGYVVIKKTKILRDKPGIELTFAYLVTIVFFGLLATLVYAFKLNPLFSRVICWTVIVGSTYIFLRQQYFKNIWRLRFPLICLVLMTVFSSAFIGLTFNDKYSYIPDPVARPDRNYHVLNVKVLNVAQTQANDNYIPYRQAQFFVNRSDPAKDCFICEWGVSFFQRTPLMGAVTANYFTLLNDKPPIDYTWSLTGTDPAHTYTKFQIIANIMNALFIVPAFFILTKLFNKKSATVTCLFLVTSQFFLYNAVFSWPKSLVAFFVLTSWLLILERKMRYTVLAGIASGVAYLTHDLAVLYIGASVLLLLYNRRLKEMLVFGLTSFAFAIPWLLTANFIYHEPSSFIYYPLSIGGIPQTNQGKEIIYQFLHTSPLRLLVIKIENLFYLLSPYELITSEGGQKLSIRLWALGLFSIPGSLGIGLIIPTFLGAIKKLQNINLWLLTLTPVVLSTIIIGWPKGLGALHFAEAVTILLSGLGVFYLSQQKNKKWLLFAFIANCIQLVFFITYSYKFTVGVWLTHPGDIMRLIVMVAITLFCGWAIYKTVINKKIWIAT